MLQALAFLGTFADIPARYRMPWWFYLLAGPVVVAWALVERGRRERIWVGRARREVSRRPGAEVNGGSFLRERRITIPGPPCPAIVRWWVHTLRKGAAPRRIRYTEYLARIPDGRRRLRVATEGWRDGKVAVDRSLQVGDPQFDLAYDVASNDPGWSLEFLDDVTRDRIRRLDAIHSGPFLLFVRGEQLIVRVNGRLGEEHRLEKFLEECSALAERAMGRPAGVEVTAVGAGGEAECQVCGTAIDAGRRVACRSCGTQHHDDCWAYNDGCSTFGCGGRKADLQA